MKKRIVQTLLIGLGLFSISFAALAVEVVDETKTQVLINHGMGGTLTTTVATYYDKNLKKTCYAADVKFSGTVFNASEASKPLVFCKKD